MSIPFQEISKCLSVRVVQQIGNFESTVEYEMNTA